jgi:hypothetical protein
MGCEKLQLHPISRQANIDGAYLEQVVDAAVRILVIYDVFHKIFV